MLNIKLCSSNKGLINILHPINDEELVIKTIFKNNKWERLPISKTAIFENGLFEPRVSKSNKFLSLAMFFIDPESLRLEPKVLYVNIIKDLEPLLVPIARRISRLYIPPQLLSAPFPESSKPRHLECIYKRRTISPPVFGSETQPKNIIYKTNKKPIN